ncbi:hypothetical protein V8G54_013972 [Vigna mungo]|uniref:Uncharacterized protein n=1 Tax=Vigna mungo TaxID=3915 RepID=A0AAQ3NIN3_VIGMU
MFLKRFCISTSLVADVGGIYVIENGQHNLPPHPPTFEYFDKLIQTPFGVSVVFGENDDREFGVLDGLKKRGRYLFSSLKVVVNVCVDVESGQGGMKVASESVARVFASEAEEDVVFFLRGCSGGRRA